MNRWYFSVCHMVFHNVYGLRHQTESAFPEGSSVSICQDKPRPAGHSSVCSGIWYTGNADSSNTVNFRY